MCILLPVHIPPLLERGSTPVEHLTSSHSICFLHVSLASIYSPKYLNSYNIPISCTYLFSCTPYTFLLVITMKHVLTLTFENPHVSDQFSTTFTASCTLLITYATFPDLLMTPHRHAHILLLVSSFPCCAYVSECLGQSC